ncbi:Variant surface glycoprotein [Trypanosoma congolense IL3000]|uniref:Variant surface glycoprotein n=1 Tax=Trypanosoma congolense (strain IL3000) TaxID=1068625 RepID=F9W840_TRYCI|nr:Variant surface glycoprotein [Trypanosoma congolense IL3000]
MCFLWMGMVMMVLSGTALGTGIKEHHNHHEHTTLCDILAAAVALYTSGQAGDKLKKALGQVIFGREAGGDLAELRANFPGGSGEGTDRPNSCGKCIYNNHDHYPGKSIPHDLLCLCTVGQDGSPFKSHGVQSLCGISGGDWGCPEYRPGHSYAGDGRHWDCGGKGWNSPWDHNRLNKTWHRIIKQCLSKKADTNLQAALAALKDKKDTNQIPNWDRSSYPCGGNEISTICVGSSDYCGKKQDPLYPQWREALEELTNEDFKLFKKPTTRRKTRRGTTNDTTLSGTDEESSGETDVHATHSSQARTTADTPETTKNKIFSSFSKQEGSAHITQPFLCLLSAVFLI